LETIVFAKRIVGTSFYEVGIVRNNFVLHKWLLEQSSFRTDLTATAAAAALSPRMASMECDFRNCKLDSWVRFDETVSAEIYG
jgi:hypothetical protein